MTTLETILLCLNLIFFFGWLNEYRNRKRLEGHPLILFGNMLKKSFTDAITSYKEDPIGSLKGELQQALESENYELANQIQEEINKLEASK